MTNPLLSEIVQAAALLLSDANATTRLARLNDVIQKATTARESIWAGLATESKPVSIEEVSSSPWTVATPDCPDPTACPVKLIQPSLPIRPLPSRYRDYTAEQWAAWSDGKWHTATRGVDFSGLSTRFRDILYTHADNLGKKARTTISGNQVAFCFVDREEKSKEPVA